MTAAVEVPAAIQQARTGWVARLAAFVKRHPWLTLAIIAL